MFDMHSHILPDIDDGAENIETALEMLRIACGSDTTGIVATPHVIEGEWLPSWDKVLTECSMLAETARKSGLNISIFPGAEVMISLDILDLITTPGPYCINGGRYMLVELPAAEIPRYTDEVFFMLQARGITPIIAHPERHQEISKSPEILAKWIEKGILVQLNGASLTGRMGKRTMETAEALVLSNMVHVIGSDAHSKRMRNPDLSVAVEKIIDMVGDKQAQQMLMINPGKIINNLDVDVSEVTPITVYKKTGGFKNWLSKLWK